MSIESSVKIRSSQNDFAVTIETHVEHHMGASTVYFYLSRPIAGVTRFQTTNGEAFFTPDGRGLILHDACMILFYDLNTDEVFNLEPPPERYFTRVRIEQEALLGDLYGRLSGGKPFDPIPLAELKSRFNQGLGPVDRGLFPSAYPQPPSFSGGFTLLKLS
jgi:hypothetical protein